MKHAVSISIGSSKRNKAVEINLLGETIRIERIGTDGDMEAAALKYKELDGKVDAFGVGGADLGAIIDGKWYTLHSVTPMVRYVKKTPLVDGGGLKNTLENKAPAFLEQNIGDYIKSHGRKVLVTLGADRWGLARAFSELGYETVYGDLMFGLDLPIAIHSLKGLKTAASLLMPIASRLPFEWIYPTGEKQEKRTPKWGKYYDWATVIAGDCHYIKRFMPDDLTGKVIVTNTTTPEDVEAFRKAGVKYLVTTTPVLDGRSFGTNMMEAALVALSGKGRPLTWPELSEMIDKLGFQPQLQDLERSSGTDGHKTMSNV
ncbi:MAG: quinate 5-dehydrogenase [Chloroflexi bacterium CFX2]|nr:quinate 5-dehydrogenase [Chloroflexi bacterium CFX2]